MSNSGIPVDPNNSVSYIQGEALQPPNDQQLQYDQLTQAQLQQLQLMTQYGAIDPAQYQALNMNSRGAWTQQEDEQLINAVHQLGAKKWTDIAKFVPTRTSKQCRERWHHRLDPELKREPFEAWEDQVIIEKQAEIGNRWALIAHQLPGRSASAVKNRWYSGLRSHHPTHAQMDLTLAMQVPTDTMPTLDEGGNIIGSMSSVSADL